MTRRRGDHFGPEALVTSGLIRESERERERGRERDRATEETETERERERGRERELETRVRDRDRDRERERERERGRTPPIREREGWRERGKEGGRGGESERVVEHVVYLCISAPAARIFLALSNARVPKRIYVSVSSPGGRPHRCSTRRASLGGIGR